MACSQLTAKPETFFGGVLGNCRVSGWLGITWKWPIKVAHSAYSYSAASIIF